MCAYVSERQAQHVALACNNLSDILSGVFADVFASLYLLNAYASIGGHTLVLAVWNQLTFV